MKKIIKTLLIVNASVLFVSFSKVVNSDSSEIENKAQKYSFLPPIKQKQMLN